MRTTVKKYGNGVSVRIPAAIMDAAKLGLDTVVVQQRSQFPPARAGMT